MNVSRPVSRTVITCGCLLAALIGPVVVVSAAPASAAHPSRVLARLREAPASVQAAGDLVSMLEAVGLQQAVPLRIHRRSALVPGLVVLDTPAATAAAASNPSPQSVPADDPGLRERIRALMATGLFVYVTFAARTKGRDW